MSNVRESVEAGVEAMLEHMRDDYRGWSRSGEKDEYGHRARMEEDYADNLHYTVGSKYIKVINSAHNSNCVEAFVVNTDKDKKFRLGDILKPAGWAAPARNFPRGNVLERTFERVRWTGPYQEMIMNREDLKHHFEIARGFESTLKGVPLSEENLELCKEFASDIHQCPRSDIRIKYRGPRISNSHHTLKEEAHSFDVYYWKRYS